MSVTALLIGASTCAVTALVRGHIRAVRLRSLTWIELLARVGAAPVAGIQTIANDYLHPTKGQLALETSDLWTLVGGLEGVVKMRKNCEVLLALSGYAARWNMTEAVIVTERMRHDAETVRWASFKILLGLFAGVDRVRGPLYIQQAAASYHLMRERLLALYETSHAGRYSALAATV